MTKKNDIFSRLMNMWSDQEKLDSTMVLYAIILYPLFGVNHFLHGQEPLWAILGRFILAGIFYLRYKFEKIEMVRLKNQLIWVFMSYLMILVYHSEFLPDYLIGYFLALFVSTLVMDDPKSIFQFYIFVVLFSLTSFLDAHAEVKPSIIVMVNFVVGLISFILVAGRKGLQLKLVQSEEFYNQIFNQQNDPVFVTDLSGKVVFCNNEARRLFEIPFSSEGFYFHNFIYKRLNDRELRLYEKELERKGEASYETQFITIGETKFYGLLKTKLIINNGQQQHLISVTDLTTIKASQEKVKALLVDSEKNNKELTVREEKMKILLAEVKATEQKFRSLNKALPVGVFMTDKIGNCIYANPKLLEILQIEYNDIIGEGLEKFVDPDKQEHYNEFVSFVLNELSANISEEREFHFVQKQSLNLIPAKIKMNALVLENKVFGYVGTIEDISNLVKKEIALIQSNKEAIKAKLEAETALKVRSEFLSNMSHEIRTPINAIIGLTDILINEVEGEVYENLKVIKYSADSLLSLVNDVLDFSKLESGKFNFENIDFNIFSLGQNLIKTIAIRAQQNGLVTDLKIAPNVPEIVIGDSHRLNQILLNICVNAVKFTKLGYVKLKISLIKEDGEIVTLLFEVEDSGIGIAEEKIENIFEEFTQAENSTTRQYGGTGLGLTITKKLIELQGGKIYVKSTLNVGTSFFVELPFSKSTDKSIKENNEIPTFNYNLNGLKILLVEDNKVNQIVANQLLKRWNTEIIVANNGKEAIQVLEKETVELVLMDLQMPIMNGYDATILIRQKHSSVLNHNVPIIALTANVFPEVRIKVFESGMNGYVTKPFEQDKLYKAIIDVTSNFAIQSNIYPINENLDTIMYKNHQFIDLTELLLLVDNDEDALAAVMGEFVETTPVDVQELNNSVQESNLEKITAWAHKLKSSFRHFGMTKAANACLSLELIGKGKQSNEELDVLLQIVNEQFAGGLNEVKNKLSEFN